MSDEANNAANNNDSTHNDHNEPFYRAIHAQIAPRFEENEIRLRIARSEPGPNVLRYRNQGWLNQAEVERDEGFRQLKALTSTITSAQADMLLRTGIIESLITLASYRWCQVNIGLEPARMVAGTAAVASNEQVCVLVEMGCIPLLCEGLRQCQDRSTAQSLTRAIQRILETGQANAATQGRNIYTEQIKGAGGLEHLKALREREILQGDAFEGIVPFFDVQEQTRTAALNDPSERGQGWNLFYPFLKQGQFPKWKRDDTATFQVETACPLKIKLFISHRWENPSNPDPTGEQLRSVVEYLSRIFMVANGWLDKTSHIARDITIGERLLAHFEARKLNTCRCGTDPYLDLRSVLGHNEFFYSRVKDIHARRNFYQLLKHVHVWYDFASMPQAPHTPDERMLFEQRLNQLADIAGQSDVIVLWGNESLHRAWCVLEGMVGQHLHFCGPSLRQGDWFSEQVFQALNSNTEFEGFRDRNSLSISISVQQIKQDIQGKSEGAILEYLEQHGITCTHAEDVAIVARLLHRFVQPIPGDKSAG